MQDETARGALPVLDASAITPAEAGKLKGKALLSETGKQTAETSRRDLSPMGR